MVGGNKCRFVVTALIIIHKKCIQVVVRAKRAQLLIFLELARCTCSVQIEIKDVICKLYDLLGTFSICQWQIACSVADRSRPESHGGSTTETTILYKTNI